MFNSEIVKREKSINKLLDKIKGKKPSQIKLSVSKPLNSLENKQRVELSHIILEENDSFRKLYEENQKLLTNDNIELKPTKEGGSTYSAYTKVLSGSVYKNGFLYLNNQKNNNILNPFGAYFYAKEYTGIISPLGITEVHASLKGFYPFGSRVPHGYIGSIDSSGKFHFKVKDSRWESHGGYFVKRIIADPFAGEKNKRAQFLNNKGNMIDEINNFRKQIII